MIKDNKNKKTRNASQQPVNKPAPLKIKKDGYMKKTQSRRSGGSYDYIKQPGASTVAQIDYDMPENKYYSNIADRIKLAKWLSVVFLVLFVFGGLVLNSKELNADNLGYLLRYLNIQGSAKATKSEFYVELDEASSIRYYKNNIAVLRKNRLDIYDMNGKRNFTSRLVYSNPVLKTSDRYILAYDLGSNKMEIFNSFSRVFEYKSDRPIYGAEITDKGSVVYITTEKGYKSAVYVTDNGFNIIYKCLFDKDYIVGADIDEKGERLAVAGFYAQDGDYLSRVILYETGSEKPTGKIEIYGEQAYGVKLNETGVFAVFENSFRVYDFNGTAVSSYNFAYRKIQKISLASEYAAVVLSEKTLGTDDRILIFDKNGNIAYDNIVGAEIIDIKFSADYNYLYFLTREGLYKIDVEQKIFEFVTNEYDETTNAIIYANETNIFLSGLLKINAIETP